MKAQKIFKINRIIELKTGVVCRLHMDLFKIGSTGKATGELGEYKLSWIFFEIEDPTKRILMDNHEPIGLHLHINDGPQIPVSAQKIEDAQMIFFAAIKNYFGEEIEV